MNRLRSSRRWRRSLDSGADMSHTWPAFMAVTGGLGRASRIRRAADQDLSLEEF